MRKKQTTNSKPKQPALPREPRTAPQPLTIEERANLAELDGIPKWIFYHELSIRMREAAVQAFLEAIPELLFWIDRDGTFLDFKASKDIDILMPWKKFPLMSVLR